MRVLQAWLPVGRVELHSSGADLAFPRARHYAPAQETQRGWVEQPALRVEWVLRRAQVSPARLGCGNFNRQRLASDAPRAVEAGAAIGDVDAGVVDDDRIRHGSVVDLNVRDIGYVVDGAVVVETISVPVAPLGTARFRSGKTTAAINLWAITSQALVILARPGPANISYLRIWGGALLSSTSANKLLAVFVLRMR